jgi:hypothetical protein
VYENRPVHHLDYWKEIECGDSESYSLQISRLKDRQGNTIARGPGWPDEFVKSSPKMKPNTLFVKISANVAFIVEKGA